MDKFVITGGKRLSGAVVVACSKNATLPIICAALLAESGRTVLSGIPDLVDIRTAVAVCNHLGARAEYDGATGTLAIDASGVNGHEVPYDLMRRMRASFLFLGSLLGRMHQARVSLPGGCSFGPRPVDLHLRGFEALGVKFTEDHGYVLGDGRAMASGTLVFDRPTHTGTENLMIGAAMLPGETVLVNAACDPEIADLADFLNKMGAKIAGAGTATIRITGVKKLRGTEHEPIPDRLEAGTVMIAAAMTRGTVELTHVEPLHLEAVTGKLREMGTQITAGKGRLTVKGQARLWPVRVVTFPYPGFPTDLQPAILALLTIADGASLVTETVFPNRFSHAMEMARMGADIQVSGDEARVAGVPRLRGASVMAADIRAGAGVVLAALGAEGISEVRRVYHIDRGYDHLESKLEHLGADIKRAKDD
ncbi:MAG: UDP-N-acetylglucosamine 1-carboxyvinyltransferase [candidate division Zixibacteria bacterium]|nr:UDP-N-acetylglucosamine 1-carboxyvinyltransferase [candidate division Zixibacteria bacterium]